ncbi:hypothetical protein [Pedococcus bigeumensis]|uniref:hypothetical protein n=1 Tax=Pedococcus bigeumensis TaxID=433644 RepID=UPI0031D32F1D
MTSLSDAATARPAEPALFAGLVDDAAVFPPGNAPLAEAVRLHRVHRASGYAACVGPLLVPASAAAELAGLLEGAPLRVAVIGRPGTPAAEVADAVTLLRQTPGVEVAGVELGWTPDWRATDFGGLPRTLEVPRGPEQEAVVADIAAEASDSVVLQAKFRTGATETWAWPDETELAAFVRTAVDHDLGFKLTGGLHHVVRGTHDGHDQHGLLNVLSAVRWALNGEDVDELAPLLAERDVAVLVPQITRMSAADAAIVRAFFTAYGCCEVTDPLAELTTLGLIQGA